MVKQSKADAQLARDIGGGRPPKSPIKGEFMGTQQAQPKPAEAKTVAKSRGTVSSLFSGPKFLFFLAAALSFVMSVSLFFTGSREQGIYVGIWVPSILSAGALLLGNSRDE